MVSIHLLVGAKDDESPARPEHAKPLNQNGFGVLEVLQKVRAVDIVKNAFPEPMQASSVAPELNRLMPGPRIWIWQIDTNGRLGNRVAARPEIKPIANAERAEPAAEFRCFALILATHVPQFVAMTRYKTAQCVGHDAIQVVPKH